MYFFKVQLQETWMLKKGLENNTGNPQEGWGGVGWVLGGNSIPTKKKIKTFLGIIPASIHDFVCGWVGSWVGG